MLLVCYDIADTRRRNRVARLLEGYGQRVQKSVFECHLDPRREATMRRELAALIDRQCDKLSFYGLCEKDRALALAWGSLGISTCQWLWVA